MKLSDLLEEYESLAALKDRPVHDLANLFDYKHCTDLIWSFREPCFRCTVYYCLHDVRTS